LNVVNIEMCVTSWEFMSVTARVYRLWPKNSDDLHSNSKSVLP